MSVTLRECRFTTLNVLEIIFIYIIYVSCSNVTEQLRESYIKKSATIINKGRYINN
jgi:hypothetical protein